MIKVSLHKDEKIIAVVPEFAHGPGWTNSPLWVYIAGNGLKSLRTVCIQPEQQTAEMRTLFAPGAAMAAALVGTIRIHQLKGYSTDF